MKTKVFWSFFIVLPVIIFSLYNSNAQNQAQTTTSHIMIKYFPAAGSGDIFVFRGGSQIEKISLTKDEVRNSGLENRVLDLLNKYSEEGYVLVATESFSVQSFAGIQLYLKKQ